MAFPGAGPMPNAQPPSPEAMPAGGVSPEVQTILASPLADRLVGPLMAMQKMGKMAKVGDAIRGLLQGLAKEMLEFDPKKSATLEQLSAKILTLLPQPEGPPTAQGQQNK